MPVQPLPLRLAGAVLLAGGLVIGAAPMPLADFGCPPALDAVPAPVAGSDVETIFACGQMRADRQLLVGALLTAGVATLALSVPGRAAARSREKDPRTTTAV